MRSDTVKKSLERAPHRSLLYATGVRKKDIQKPKILADCAIGKKQVYLLLRNN